MSEAEMAVVRRIAKREGITDDEAASRLASEALQRRIRKRTGKAPARVYSMPAKKAAR